MLHYRTSHTSYHTDMHKWIGAHTCKQDTHRHTLLYTQLIAQILLSCSHEQVSSPEYAQRCTNTHNYHSRVVVIFACADNVDVPEKYEKVQGNRAN